MALHNGPGHNAEVEIPSEEELREAYIEQDLTRPETAEELGTSVYAVRKGIIKYDLYKQGNHGPTIGIAAKLARLGERRKGENAAED